MRPIVFGYKWLGFMSYFGLLCLLPVVMGCGPGKGKVSGRVLYNGAPLPGGWVTFRPAEPKQNTVSAALDQQGNYQVVLPSGMVKVSVDNRELEPRAPRGAVVPSDLPPEVKKLLTGGKRDQSPSKSSENAAAKTTGRYVEIPHKYYDTETSGLAFTVQGGDQKHDIELTK
jgi:hypothetical protein